jgi:hypothetical protein
VVPSCSHNLQLHNCPAVTDAVHQQLLSKLNLTQVAQLKEEDQLLVKKAKGRSACNYCRARYWDAVLPASGAG